MSTVADAPSERFEAERPRLVGLAYRILGSRLDAEDVVQEAWLRLQAASPGSIRDEPAWLTTVVSRLALDVLRSARVRREQYVGPWLPEPVLGRSGVGASADPADDPAHAAEMAESLTFGFLRMLEALGPEERVIFLLADVFRLPFADIAAIVDRSPAACRQAASRARKRVRTDRDHPSAAPADARDVATQLVGAIIAGDLEQVVSLLADGAVLISDGGALARAARQPVIGPHRISRFLVNISHRMAGYEMTVEPAELNGDPGVVVRLHGILFMALALHVRDGRVTDLHMVRNPDKLAALNVQGNLV
ncbi:MAG: RNA polymerase sigma factor SigJ [Acidimicrobiales bacterium]|nr:RNA polymerase sigma factor SigJ [Acidimicrobiales bacterium]